MKTQSGGGNMPVTIVEGIELKNCPHCGAEAHIKTDYSQRSIFWPRCSNKDCAASQVSSKSAEDAATLWNQRV